MKLIVGLGNPGKDYDKTRHNMGFMIIDYFASKYNVEIKKEKFNGLYAEMVINGEKVLLLKPQSYMNLSGEVVRKFVDYFKVEIDDILVISDDLDLPFLKVRLRASGSSGGHNGLKNIELHLNTREYKRLKVGISNNKDFDTRNYVTSRFSETDMKLFNESLEFLAGILEDYCYMDFLKLVNKYN